VKKNPWLMLLVLLVAFGALGFFLVGSSMISLLGNRSHIKMVHKDSILRLRLDGVIMDGEKFLKALKKYREDKDIKAVVVEINSPGGVVGPSQEIFSELKRTREEFKKPVVAVSAGLMASGAYYSAVGADKIIVAPGALVGSIGVIMEFANLEKLYEWAKISRFTIATGKYKDSGNEFRAMRDDEKELFQSMINEVWEQFKQAVADGRKLKPEEVEPYADGRVFTGAFAVKKGLADQEGTIDSAYEVAAELAGLEDYDIFEVPKERPSLLEFLTMEDEEATSATQIVDHVFNKAFKADLVNRPLLLMPGYWP
jgi:protease-4